MIAPFVHINVDHSAVRDCTSARFHRADRFCIFTHVANLKAFVDILGLRCSVVASFFATGDHKCVQAAGEVQSIKGRITLYWQAFGSLEMVI